MCCSLVGEPGTIPPGVVAMQCNVHATNCCFKTTARRSIVYWNPVQEAHDLALQREALKKRHLPGGADSIGDDPLLASSEESTSGSSPCRVALSSTGAVRLELGMDTKELDELLTEIEVNIRLRIISVILTYR